MEIDKHFKPLYGQQPKRARVGYGSFLTFDFGRASKRHHRLWYEWHLWIQHVDWRLMWRNQDIAQSESKRQVMEAALRRLETKTLEKVVHDPQTRETRFVFSGNAQLICKAYDDSASDEESWSLYTPDTHVLFANSSGKLQYTRSDVPRSARPVPRRKDDRVRV